MKKLLRARLAEWHQVHNNADEEALYRLDGKNAEALGLPTLASICYLLDDISHAQGPIHKRELESRIRKTLRTALGEATVRLRISLEDEYIDGPPGVPELPVQLLERLVHPDTFVY